MILEQKPALARDPLIIGELNARNMFVAENFEVPADPATDKAIDEVKLAPKKAAIRQPPPQARPEPKVMPAPQLAMREAPKMPKVPNKLPNSQLGLVSVNNSSNEDDDEEEEESEEEEQDDTHVKMEEWAIF